MRAPRDELFFLKNGWECDFVRFRHGMRPLLVQVTEQLQKDNYEREVQGLLKAKNRIKDAEGLILVADLDVKPEKLPNWVTIMDVSNWLLEN